MSEARALPRRVVVVTRSRLPIAVALAVSLLVGAWAVPNPLGVPVADRNFAGPHSGTPREVFVPRPEKTSVPSARSVQSSGARAPRGDESLPQSAAQPLTTLRELMSEEFAFRDVALRAAARHSVEPSLVLAIIASESGGNPAALSPAGAIGLMQLMPATANELGVDPWNPVENVEGAVRYLSSQLARFKSVELSLVAYNAGPSIAARYRVGDVGLDAETRGFIARVGKILE